MSELSNAQNGMPTAAQIRESISGDIRSFNIAGVAINKIENRTVWTGTDSIKIRVYYPNNNSNNRIIYNIHGGALIACDLDTHDNISRLLAKNTNSIVVAVDYRKPPEFPYPASILDCEKVLSWIQQNAASIKGNAKNIVLLGESGGCLMVTSLAVKLRERLGAIAICLINPANDLRNPSDGLYKLVTYWYLNGKDPNDSLVSPILAKDFRYYPKTLIITCEKDELKPHGTALYEKLKSSGKEVEYMDIEKEDHLGGMWAANHPNAKKAVDRTIAFINALK
jgi:acetyl esterase